MRLNQLAALDKKAQKIKQTLGSTNTPVLQGSYIALEREGVTKNNGPYQGAKQAQHLDDASHSC